VSHRETSYYEFRDQGLSSEKSWDYSEFKTVEDFGPCPPSPRPTEVICDGA
jgi:hypothetical protein